MRRPALVAAAAVATAATLALTPSADAAPAPEHPGSAVEAMGIRHLASRTAGTTSISYHNGPVMTSRTGTNVYVIWYGSWDANGGTVSAGSALLTKELQSIGGTSYFGINTTYYDATGTHVTNAVAFAGSTTDAYSQGKKLSDAGVKAVVSSAVTAGRLPKDANALYFVLTSKDVSETSGFLTRYCGWHTHASISGLDLKYAFVGDPTGTHLSSCAQQLVGPNGAAYAGADAMASVVAHELEETVTDPDLNAWYDGSGAENADKCAWTFGATSTAANGAQYNVTWNGTQFLIQQNWSAGTQACGLQ